MNNKPDGNAVRVSHRDCARWREEFPVTRQFAYFDHASVCPTPRRAVKAVTDSLAAQGARGSLEHPALHDLAEEARLSYAALIGANASSIAHVPNTSLGISLIAQGIEWRNGDEVVVPAIDFPSAVLPWMTLAGQGVIVRSVPCVDGRVAIDDLMNACNDRTRVVCTSWVQFSSGYRMDLQKLGEICRRRGIFLVVDGAQGVGALHLEIGQLPVDALVTHGYKWLLGPQGVGWLYLGDKLAGELALTAAGLRGMTPRESYFDHRFTPRTDAARFETGILDFHGIAGALASVELLREIGTVNIEGRIADLVDRLYTGLCRAGWEVKGGSVRSDFRSGILAARHPGKDPKECHGMLLQHNVVTSVREGYVRISPHFYNSEADVDRMLAALSGKTLASRNPQSST